MGFIYYISNSINDKVYVGKTTTSIQQRWREHRNDAKKYERHIQSGGKFNGCPKFYRAILCHGVENFEIEMLEEADNDELDKLEMQYIEAFDAITNGYNILAGGEGACHTLESAKQFRTHDDILEGLPLHSIYIKYGIIEGVAINKHPRCHRKNFTVKKYGSIDKAKEALLKYYDDLENNRVEKPLLVKRDPSLPKGVNKIKNCYFVDKKRKGIIYRKSFSGLTDDENKQAALAYLNEILMK